MLPQWHVAIDMHFSLIHMSAAWLEQLCPKWKICRSPRVAQIPVFHFSGASGLPEVLFHLRRWQKHKKASPTAQAHSRPVHVSSLLMSHWPKPSSRSKGEGCSNHLHLECEYIHYYGGWRTGTRIQLNTLSFSPTQCWGFKLIMKHQEGGYKQLEGRFLPRILLKRQVYI